MCLSVYIGTSGSLNFPKDVPTGGLSFEPASWRPPTLEKVKYVYYLGQKTAEEKLGCSCLLWEQVDWHKEGCPVESDDNYKNDVECAFLTLHNYCEVALKQSDNCIIVCDDSNGLEQTCNKEDYHSLFLTLKMIERGNLLFGSPRPYPYRHFNVVKGEFII